MATVMHAPPALSDELTLFHTTDPLLSNLPLLVLYGQAASLGATSSRVQLHIFTAAGHASYPRLAISPNSPFYSAVSNLPREEQGDEQCRAVAFGLKKYFAELSGAVKETWCRETKAVVPSALFGDEHVAILATRMSQVEYPTGFLDQLTKSFGEARLSWMDIDVVLPPGSIKDIRLASGELPQGLDEAGLLRQRYGRYGELVSTIGEVAFLPTSKIRRAPSKASQLGRATSFSLQQRINIEKELLETLVTEENYVERLLELIQIFEDVCSGLDVTLQQQVMAVCPEGTRLIATRHVALLHDLRQDLKQNGVHIQRGSDCDKECDINTLSDAEITSSLVAFCTVLSNHLPECGDVYGNYIKSQPECIAYLTSVMKGPQQSIIEAIKIVGEQKLTSLLIEPVQRLPRYALFIDTILKQLPVRHEAIQPLLNARDRISDICDQQHSKDTASNVVQRLKNKVSNWPDGTLSSGRLISICDFTELVPPYTLQISSGPRGLLLLFTDCIILLEKTTSKSISARGLLTEIEMGSILPPVNQASRDRSTDLLFSQKITLDSMECLESDNGECLNVFGADEHPTLNDPRKIADFVAFRCLRLEGPYERRAERIVEEISKARIEHRFSEAERDTAYWELRASDPAAETVSLHCAIFDNVSQDHINARRGFAISKIIVDIDRHSHKPRPSTEGVRTVVCITPLRDGLWRVTFDSIDGSIAREHLPISEIFPIIRKRLETLTIARLSIEHTRMTACLLARNASAVQCLHDQIDNQDSLPERQPSTASKEGKPKSPRKLLSNFLGNSGLSNNSSGLLKKDLPPLPRPKQLSRFPSNTSRPPSRETRPTSGERSIPNTADTSTPITRPRDPLIKLEDTLSAYILALHARKGNVVGRTLKMRSGANELDVNELYNSLLEDPTVMNLAAQASVDVLFAAFEKFLQFAWREQVGDIFPLSLLKEVESNAETMFPADFDNYFRNVLTHMKPQNQKAFKAVVQLLAELLDGTGNDGDRGILTAAFAEVLIIDGNSHDFIPLFDRFVDDPDTYFGEPLDITKNISLEPTKSHKRSRSVNAASITSNTSSLRRKFGLSALTRENSKSEPDSKISSVWRTLSKTSRSDASPASSISKASIHRSQSIDPETRASRSRPSSRDSTTQRSLYSADEHSVLSIASVHSLGLSTIGENSTSMTNQPPKKKRRSSLSDLLNIDDATKQSALWSSPSVRRQHPEQKDISTPSRFGSPLPPTSITQLAVEPKISSTTHKEHSPSLSKNQGSIMCDEPSITSLGDVNGNNKSRLDVPPPLPKHNPTSQSPLPGRGAGLFERRDAGNAVKKRSPSPEKGIKHSLPPSTPATSPKKLRMQSPQKLRERLHTQQSHLDVSQAEIHRDLDSISQDLSSTIARTPHQPDSRTAFNGAHLTNRITQMEQLLQQQRDDMRAKIARIEADVSSSLSVSETKNKRLDELYREANSENEALYNRFNDELGRILKAVRSGEGVNELRQKLKESQEEALKLKRENVRLKRENVGLRSQMKE